MEKVYSPRSMMSEEIHPRTLYVGNLDASVSEDLLCAVFSQIGPIKSCKIIREPGNDPYAFLEFTNHRAAATARAAMNKRSFLEKEIKVNWATSPGNQPKKDTSNHYHIFVGDLCPEIETHTLRAAFAPFGEMSNCRIVRDPQTLESKGYAFVSFVKRAEAESAISAMNGQWLGSRSIRTNWSLRRMPLPRSETFDEVYNQASPTNCTVYCGGYINGITEALMHKTFAPFGSIMDIRVFKEKGYAFIRFQTKESATRAIESIHYTEVNGHIVKCFWGKENGDPNNMQNVAAHTPTATQYQYPYGEQMGYWYPQGYQAQAATGAQMQGQYALQAGMQYPYGEFGYQQAYGNMAGSMGMQLPAGWQGVQTNPGADHQIATAAQDAAMQQQPGMTPYMMEQFQTQ